jgi:predicted nucleotidyltransferase
MELLKNDYPHYRLLDPVFNEWMSEVPRDHITIHYKPQDTIKLLNQKERLDEVEQAALEFLDLLVETTGISQQKVGISGSVMVNLHLPTSDLDLLVYGTQNCLHTHKILQSMLRDDSGLIRAYDHDGLKKLYSFRVKDTPMSFQDFCFHAGRKSSQGTFQGRDFSLRYVKDWDEVKETYGDKSFTSFGQVTIQATVIDDSEAIFTPCRYIVENVESPERKKMPLITEVTSFRGRFSQHVQKGEVIIAHGKLEKVTTREGAYYHLMVGGSAQDYIITRRMGQSEKAV